MQYFDSFIIDTDLEARMRLRQAMTSISSFKNAVQLGSIRDSIKKLETTFSPVDVIFISYRIDEAEVQQFISIAKNTVCTQDAAFILIKNSNDQNTSSIAASMLAGADGLLFEPFSVDQLVEITTLANKVKSDRSSAREAVALKFILSDVINQIDQAAYLKAMEYETAQCMKKLKDMCSVFQSLSPDSILTYQKLAIEAFESAPIPKMVFQKKKYVGNSSRVQKRMEKKTLSALGLEEPNEQNKG